MILKKAPLVIFRTVRVSTNFLHFIKKPICFLAVNFFLCSNGVLFVIFRHCEVFEIFHKKSIFSRRFSKKNADYSSDFFF